MGATACRAVVVALSALAGGCLVVGGEIVVGSGRVVEESRAVEAFTRVEATSGIRAEVVQGFTRSVVVRADDNVVDRVRTEVSGDTLVIDFEPVLILSSSAGVRVSVSVPQLVGVEASGGAWIEADRVNASRFEVVLSGGAVGLVSGVCDELEAEVSGGSRLDTDALFARRVWIDASGGSQCAFHAADELDATASGGSRLTCSGAPTRQSIELSGGSTLEID